MARRRGRRPGVLAVVAAGALLAGACGSSSADDDAVVVPTSETTVEGGGGPATTDPGGGGGEDDEIALVEEATTVLVEYLDAYFRADHEVEVDRSGQWARQYAYLRTIAGTTGEPQQGDYEVDITGISEVADGWELEGSLTLTLADVEHTYTDIFLVEGEGGDLVVADYCRTNPDGAGPLDGCLSQAVGNVNQKMTSEDGTVTVTLGPFARSMGMGRQSTTFSVVIDNTGTVPVRVVGGPLATSYLIGGVESVSVPSTSAERLAPAAPGERSTGVLETNQPDDVDAEDPFPAGTLKFQVETEDGRTLSFGPYEIPALPQLVD